jgi:predicted nucleic acid-binding protein
VIVADTDVLIDALAGVHADRVRRELRRRALATAAVSAYELWRGARTKQARAQVGELLAVLQILPFDARAAELAGAAYRELAGEGEVIGKADLYVAGVCLAARVPLLTRNRREFERVRGLRLA